MDKLAQQVLGKYRVLEEMGRGGFGIVYRAEDTALGNREVALKVLHPQLVVDPASVRLFTQEAGTAARLRHRHIVTIYEADTYQDRRYIAMEFLPGPSLAALLASEGPQPVERVTAWVEQAASALDLAHLRGVVHRDLKPSNLLLDAEGQVMVTDFGLARATEASGGVSSSRDSGIMTGTARYMAPEQARRGKATAASDVYSLGIVAYELLTGHTPFEEGDAFAIALQQINEPPPPLRQFCPELPEAVEQAVLKALAKEPAERYLSAGALADALSEAVHGPQVEAERRRRAEEEQARRAEEERERQKRAEKRQAALVLWRRWLLAGGVVLLAMAGIALLAVWGIPRWAEWRGEQATEQARITETAAARTPTPAPVSPMPTKPPQATQTAWIVVTERVVVAERTVVVTGTQGPVTNTATATGTATATATCTATATPKPTSTAKPKATAVTGPAKQLDWGDYVVWTSGGRTYNWSQGLSVTEIATGKETRISTETNLTQAAWAPDGSKIVACAWRRNYRKLGEQAYYDSGAWLLNADGGTLTSILLAEGWTSESVPVTAIWSQDGHTLAVRYQFGADFGVFTLAPNGTGPRQRVAASAISDYPLAWSTDGKWIIVRSAADGGYYGLEVSGSRRLPLAELGSLKFHDQRYWPWVVTDQVACLGSLNPKCE